MPAFVNRTEGGKAKRKHSGLYSFAAGEDPEVVKARERGHAAHVQAVGEAHTIIFGVRRQVKIFPARCSATDTKAGAPTWDAPAFAVSVVADGPPD